MNHQITGTRNDDHQHPPRDANPVITGTSTTCSLRAARPRTKLPIVQNVKMDCLYPAYPVTHLLVILGTILNEKHVLIFHVIH